MVISHLTNMLADSKNLVSGLTASKPIASLRAWCNYGKSMEVDMTATPFKMTRFGMAIGKERIDYTLQAIKPTFSIQAMQVMVCLVIRQVTSKLNGVVNTKKQELQKFLLVSQQRVQL